MFIYLAILSSLSLLCCNIFLSLWIKFNSFMWHSKASAPPQKTYRRRCCQLLRTQEIDQSSPILLSNRFPILLFHFLASTRPDFSNLSWEEKMISLSLRYTCALVNGFACARAKNINDSLKHDHLLEHRNFVSKRGIIGNPGLLVWRIRSWVGRQYKIVLQRHDVEHPLFLSHIIPFLSLLSWSCQFEQIFHPALSFQAALAILRA